MADPNLDTLAGDVGELLPVIARAVDALAASAQNSQPDPRAAELHNEIRAAMEKLNSAVNTATGASNPSPVSDGSGVNQGTK